MSKPALILFLGALAVIIGPAGRCDAGVCDLPRDREAVFRGARLVPAGIYRTGSRADHCHGVAESRLEAFYIWPTETPRSWLAAYRGDGEDLRGDEPAAFVNHHEAEAFGRWFSRRYGVKARLPTREEWEAAARSGKGGVTYSWGWTFDERPVRRDGALSLLSERANAWGLHHMCGSVGEWCAADPDSDGAWVMGGSWAERDPRFLRVSHRLQMPRTYRDADVGFRLVIDPPAEETVASARADGG